MLHTSCSGRREQDVEGSTAGAGRETCQRAGPTKARESEGREDEAASAREQVAWLLLLAFVVRPRALPPLAPASETLYLDHRSYS